MNEITMIPVGLLEHHPENPRKDLGDLTELTASIKKNGIMQNLTVVQGHMMSKKEWTEAAMAEGATKVSAERSYDPENAWVSDGYTVVIGNRRMEAAKLAGLAEVPCVISDMDHKTQIATMLEENMQRADLTVYEQAQGFQMMMDLGYSAADIAEKTGFGETTVRRRIKMAEMDAKMLKKACEDKDTERQITLLDFDRLAQIKDMELRNNVLKSIGTRDFDEALAKAKKKELIACKLPALKGWLQEHNAQQIFMENTYGGRYTSWINNKSFSYIYIDKLGDPGNTLPDDQDIQGRQLFYLLRDEYVTIYIENPRNTGSTTRGKKTEAEKARDRTMREVRAKIRELTALHYGLRKDFIENLVVTKANRDKVIAGALRPALYFAWNYSGYHSATIRETMGADKNAYSDEHFWKALQQLTDKDLARAVYAVYNDNEENWFAADMLSPATIPSYPKNCRNVLLKLLYEWLISLGYESSTEEQALMDGSHEIYKKAKKGAKS